MIVENGSTDDTWQELLSQTKNDNFIHVFQIGPLGPGAARNKGIKVAQGRYVLFLDADDPINSDLLNKYDMLDQDGSYDLIVASFKFDTIRGNKVVVSRNYVMNEHEYQNNSELIRDLYNLMNGQFMYVVWNKRYVREVLIQNQIVFPHFFSCEDRIFNVRYMAKCNHVLTTDEILSTYEYDAEHGLTTRYDPEKLNTFKVWYEEVKQLLRESDISGVSALYLKGIMSTIFSIVRTKRITNSKKRYEVSAIYHDKTVEEAKKVAKIDSKIKLLTRLCYRLPFFLFYITVSLGSYFEYRLPTVIEKIKRKY